MTRSDKWKKRPVTDRYWNYADLIREAFGITRYNRFERATGISFTAYFETYDKALWGTPHDEKPDVSNILKGLEDILVKEDKYIYHLGDTYKYWSDVNALEICLEGVVYHGQG